MFFFFGVLIVFFSWFEMMQVYQQSIAAVCNLEWPKSKILIQVLDDSDDPTTQLLIKEEVHKWQREGAKIVYRHRVIRDGYKAGNLKSAMNCSYVKDYEFVAMFDADFQPNPDFLKRTVPHFKVLGLKLNHSIDFLIRKKHDNVMLFKVYGKLGVIKLSSLYRVMRN